jgi:hypothetical protein
VVAGTSSKFPSSRPRVGPAIGGGVGAKRSGISPLQAAAIERARTSFSGQGRMSKRGEEES